MYTNFNDRNQSKNLNTWFYTTLSTETTYCFLLLSSLCYAQLIARLFIFSARTHERYQSCHLALGKRANNRIPQNIKPFL